MTDPTKVDSSAAREAAMSRVQTQDTVLASLAAPASKEGEESSKETKPKDNQNEEGDQKAVKKTAQERIVELAHKRKEAEAKAEASELRARELEAQLQALKATAQPMEVAAKPARSQFASLSPLSLFFFFFSLCFFLFSSCSLAFSHSSCS